MIGTVDLVVLVELGTVYEGAEIFKKPVRDTDVHLGAKCEIQSRRGLSSVRVCLSVYL